MHSKTWNTQFKYGLFKCKYNVFKYFFQLKITSSTCNKNNIHKRKSTSSNSVDCLKIIINQSTWSVHCLFQSHCFAVVLLKEPLACISALISLVFTDELFAVHRSGFLALCRQFANNLPLALYKIFICTLL